MYTWFDLVFQAIIVTVMAYVGWHLLTDNDDNSDNRKDDDDNDSTFAV